MPCRSQAGYHWRNIAVFAAVGLVAAVGLPWYVLTHGITPADWALFLFFTAATGLSITVGYHRLFAHRAFEAHPVVRFLVLIFGAAAFEQSVLRWASQHRDHHRFVDTEYDPYSIRRGFFHAHIGWILFWKQVTDYDNVKDLSKDPWIRNQHEYYPLWALGAGVLLPLAIGAATGNLLGALFLGVAGRLTLVHHSTFSINSVCHTFGKATYDIKATARDHWLVAILTNGEGYHNFHHKFASDYRNGIRWYHWDPSKWMIALLSRCGMAWRLHRTSPQTILAARMAAQHERVQHEIKHNLGQEAAHILQSVRERYAQLKEALHDWETFEKDYRARLATMGERSQAYLRTVQAQLDEKKRAFEEARRAWVLLLESHPALANAART